MSCLCCASQVITEEAHVRAYSSFDYSDAGVNDQFVNIIALCPSCHIDFDRGKIAFFRCGREHVFLRFVGPKKQVRRVPVLAVDDDFCHQKLKLCSGRLRSVVSAFKRHYCGSSRIP